MKPIEQAFAKLKTLLRKAEARTVDALWTAIGQLVDCITAQDRRNLFRNCGYVRSVLICSKVPVATCSHPAVSAPNDN
jgi:hypothetical protein